MILSGGAERRERGKGKKKSATQTAGKNSGEYFSANIFFTQQQDYGLWIWGRAVEFFLADFRQPRIFLADFCPALHLSGGGGGQTWHCIRRLCELNCVRREILHPRGVCDMHTTLGDAQTHGNRAGLFGGRMVWPIIHADPSTICIRIY